MSTVNNYANKIEDNRQKINEEKPGELSLKVQDLAIKHFDAPAGAGLLIDRIVPISFSYAKLDGGSLFEFLTKRNEQKNLKNPPEINKVEKPLGQIKGINFDIGKFEGRGKIDFQHHSNEVRTILNLAHISSYFTKKSFTC